MESSTFNCASKKNLLTLECENALQGCRSCEEELVGTSLHVVCTSCKDGLYLLANETANTEVFYPEKFSFCVADCYEAHHAYVNNFITGECDCKFYFLIFRLRAIQLRVQPQKWRHVFMDNYISRWLRLDFILPVWLPFLLSTS